MFYPPIIYMLVMLEVMKLFIQILLVMQYQTGLQVGVASTFRYS
jgi:hypothetical protein